MSFNYWAVERGHEESRQAGIGLVGMELVIELTIAAGRGPILRFKDLG